jgi:hypothetical protein
MGNSSDYYNVYLSRLNRYGFNYQERTQKKREREFEDYMLKSVYLIDFEYDGEIHPGTFEKYKYDETKTLHYLLTRVNVDMPNGTILMLPDKDNDLCPWMVYYLEHIKASGYNRYIMLRMTHYLTWTARDQKEYHSFAYMYGQENNMLKDELQSRSRSDARYTENLKSSFLILPINEHIRKDDYIEISLNNIKEGYRVTGYDIQSTPGVEFVTVDPVYLYDLTPPPEKQPGDADEDFYWLEGGN